jgi:hypothetical protein
LECKVVDLEALVRAPLATNDGRIANQRVMNARVRDQISLELIQIHVQRPIKPQAARNRADDLRNQAIEVFIIRARDVEVAATDVVDGLVVDEESAVGVLNGAVGGEDGVVWLDDGRGHAGRGIDGELELAFLAVVGGEAFEEEGAKAGAGAAAEGVEDQEALEGRAIVCFGQRSASIERVV